MGIKDKIQMNLHKFEEEEAFVYEECRENLGEIGIDLLDVLNARVDVSPKLSNRVFRAFHRVTSTASHLGQESMKHLSLSAESVLAGVREGRIALTAEVAAVLLSCVDRLMIMASGTGDIAKVEFDTQIGELTAILDGRVSPQRVLLNMTDESAEITHLAPSTRFRVLIAEDDPTSRMALGSFLSKHGETHIAINGREAVEEFARARAEGHGYDLICMDVRMPEMDGTEAVRKIRAIEESEGIFSSAGVKIFMTTGVEDIRTVTSSFKALCDAYLFKPIDGSQLDAHLKAFNLVP